jgi:hypothetical protein
VKQEIPLLPSQYFTLFPHRIKSNERKGERTMATFSKTLRTGIVVTLVLAGAAAVAQGQVPAGGFFLGGTGRGIVQIKGKVVCADCTLEEVRNMHPHEQKFYQLSHRRGRVVIGVTAVNDASMFDALAWPPRLWVRGADSLLRRLGAEENLFKEMEITGLLSNSRTLAVFDVAISG